jgi:hypothetical protein
MPKMRWLCFQPFISLLLVLVGHSAIAQDADKELFLDPMQLRSDAMVVVSQQPLNAQLVEISLLDPNYSSHALEAQCQRLGTLVNSAPRGLSIQSVKVREGDAGLLKAKFGISNLIDPQQGLVRLEPLVRALGTRPGVPQIRVLTVLVEGVRPSPFTLQSWFTREVSVRGWERPIGLGSTPSIEYRIAIVADDPATISIPDRHTPKPSSPPPVKRASPKVTQYVVLGLGCLALGALVYSLLLRFGRPRSN